MMTVGGNGVSVATVRVDGHNQSLSAFSLPVLQLTHGGDNNVPDRNQALGLPAQPAL